MVMLKFFGLIAAGDETAFELSNIAFCITFDFTKEACVDNFVSRWYVRNWRQFPCSESFMTIHFQMCRGFPLFAPGRSQRFGVRARFVVPRVSGLLANAACVTSRAGKESQGFVAIQVKCWLRGNAGGSRSKTNAFVGVSSSGK